MSDASISQTTERPEFVTLIAVYQFLTAAILLLLSCLFSAAAFPAMLFTVGDPGEVFATVLLGAGVLALMIGFGVTSVIVGWGLLRMRDWARLGAIILAAFALIGFPIWTIVGILILVYLTSQEARYAFHPEEAPPEITASTFSTAEPDAAPQAAYKTEPPAQTEPDLTNETRRVTYTPRSESTNGGATEPTGSEETRSVNGPTAGPTREPTEEEALAQAPNDEEVAASNEYDVADEQYGEPSRADDLTEDEEDVTGRIGGPSEREQSASTPSEVQETDDEALDEEVGPVSDEEKGDEESERRGT